jgi:hypothetical protein
MLEVVWLSPPVCWLGMGGLRDTHVCRGGRHHDGDDRERCLAVWAALNAVRGRNGVHVGRVTGSQVRDGDGGGNGVRVGNGVCGGGDSLGLVLSDTPVGDPAAG